ncbi:site-specific integrase [Kitasatospora sp. GP82]|uniref:tyrosine-type recombinase/integrase n=1 Tax=Kitasatospora sp. GP82 TaxID=3035089 RepID=UPI0024743CD2|nr:site-specific integrase [Kitasatospora sp. GP82]MDH6126890.1 integrase [Kitasatospora sp. GP82]
MAGHIQDRWYKTETGPDGKPRRVKADRHGLGSRYRARYVGPDGTEKSKSFPDRQKRLAEQWLAHIEADMSRGQYIDPKAARVTFGQFAEKWLASQTTDLNTRSSVEAQIRRHAIPYLGSRPMDSFQPSHIREWLSELEKAVPASSYRRVIFGNVSGIFTAAIEDEIRRTNPCRSRSVTAPSRAPGRVHPWLPERVQAVRAGLPERYRAMTDAAGGCGLRQGEVFGLPVDEVGFDTGWLHVGYQVKDVGGHLVFAPPKRGKVRDVPLPERVAHAFKAHAEEFPPVEVTLPWLTPDGPPLTKPLLFSREEGGAVRRSDFNTYAWKPALVAAGVIPEPERGQRHQAAREDGMHALRHFYASVLLDAGESIKALSGYLGHSDPGFTLRVYTHLMPSSDGRTRRAVDKLYEALGWAASSKPDGP